MTLAIYKKANSHVVQIYRIVRIVTNLQGRISFGEWMALYAGVDHPAN
jgi:hypothetical protein